MDEVLLGKAAIIERCLKRIADEYIGHEAELESNFTRQDALVLNLQRACEAAIDAAMHLVRIHRLGIPTESRQAFEMLMKTKRLDPELGQHLTAMVGFRNIAVHAYQEINMGILRHILAKGVNDLAEFSRQLLKEALP